MWGLFVYMEEIKDMLTEGNVRQRAREPNDIKPIKFPPSGVPKIQGQQYMSFTFDYNKARNGLQSVVDYIYDSYHKAGNTEVIDIDYYFKDIYTYMKVGNHPSNPTGYDYMINHPTVGFRLAGITFKVGDVSLNEVEINWVGG
jgi:hypothetical protein